MEKKLNSEKIFDGVILHVTKDEVLCENGKTSFREVIHHTGGIAALVIKDHKILLVKQYRYCPQMDTLEIPAGKLEVTDHLEEEALRELEEETGYTGKAVHALDFLPTPGYTSEMIHIYKIEDVKEVKNPRQGDDDECIEKIWLDLDIAYDMILSGDILDGKTIISIMYALNNEG